jgi:hypothetical protein
MSVLKQFRHIGALWLGRTRSGAQMLTGEISVDGAVIGVVIHINSRKKPGSNQPDFLIYSTEDELAVAEDQLAEIARQPF